MHLAGIFNPIRNPLAAREGGEAELPSPSGKASAGDPFRVSRVGTQPVANNSPSGAPSTPADAPARRATDEEGWLALLELVFAETGWPDAE